jgi:integrase
MPIQTITLSLLSSINLEKNPPKRVVCYFDTEIKGFCLELRPSGGMTYYFRYRDHAKVVRLIKIGRVEEIDLSAARVKAYDIKALINEGGDPKVEYARLLSFPTFGEFIAERYLPFIKVRKRSAWMDETLLRNHLLPIFSAYRLNRIKRADIIKMHHAAKAKGFADGTCNRWLILMRFIFNCAIRWELLPLDANPCKGVELFADNGARERYLTAEEVGRLFEVLDSRANDQLAKIVKILLYTGARKREILDARWEFVDLEKRVLKVPLSKSGKPRFIALSDAAVELIQSLPRKPNVPWLFFNPKTMRPLVSVFCAWNTVRKAAGIPELRMHDLRHSFASFLVNSGRSLYEVQRLLGHYDPKVTMRYAHLSQDSLVDAANVVGKIEGVKYLKYD